MPALLGGLTVLASDPDALASFRQRLLGLERRGTTLQPGPAFPCGTPVRGELACEARRRASRTPTATSPTSAEAPEKQIGPRPVRVEGRSSV